MVSRFKRGQLLEGKYSITDKIGEGGMGVVYLATHVSLNLPVAIKVLHPLEANDQTMIERFRVEAQSSAGIRHPNIVEVTDFGLTPDGRPFFVMEFLEGDSLADLLDDRGTISEREAVHIIDQVLSALSVAHKKGIVHRDLKPENIFLANTDSGQKVVKILDFGIAKIVGGGEQALKMSKGGRPTTAHGMVMGTPGYMAPETITGQREVDARADLYAVGVLLYEMLCGRKPFQSDDLHTVMVDTISRPVPKLSLINPAVSGPMETLCHISLAKNPAQRFQSTGEFLDHLTAAAVGRTKDGGRECVTKIGLPSMIPTAPEDRISVDRAKLTESLDQIESSEFELDTSAVAERRHRPRAPMVARPGHTKGRGRPAPYKGPARTRRIILPVPGYVIVFLLLLGGSAYYLFVYDDTYVESSGDGFEINTAMPDRPSRRSPRTDKYRPSESADMDPILDGTEKLVTLWVDVTPRVSQIRINDILMTRRPIMVLESDKTSVVIVSAPGYKTKTVKIVPNKEQTLSAKLKRKSARKKKNR